MHDNQTPRLPTIESLDNIEEHYYQIDQDANITFSDNEDDNDHETDDDFMEPLPDISDISQEEKVKVSNSRIEQATVPETCEKLTIS